MYILLVFITYVYHDARFKECEAFHVTGLVCPCSEIIQSKNSKESISGETGRKKEKRKKNINPLTSELNPTAQRCLTRFFTGNFAS
jgi:hypothetical protein